MLDWKQERDGWVSNGFRIELVRPYHWVLLENDPSDLAVRTEQVPLATARTLSLCKREAELRHAASRLSELRRRYWGQLIMAVVGFSLVLPWEPVFAILLLVAVARAAVFLAGSYLARARVAVDDFFYQ